MTLQEKLNALSGTDLFGAVAEAALRELATMTRERRLVSGEVLFSGGDKADGLFVIVSGTLRAYRQTRDGREQTIHRERAGATLAEVPVFDGGPYPSTVQAEEDSVVLFVPQQAMRRFLTENPDAALAALALLARRLRSVSALAEQLALKDVAQRLAAMLWEEAVRQTGELKDGVSFSLPLPHQSIAAQLGSVREVITRQLHKLIDDGVIGARGRRITVLDAARLRKRAELEKPPAQNAHDRARRAPR
ncbi:MAG: Crp/Fnr family transcriptional regulator [Terracidiphilus sp.]